MAAPVRWMERDRNGNEIYFSQERWEHIIAPENHPEMAACESQLRDTIRYGRRKQDVLNPQKYIYTAGFDGLIEDNTHIVAIVLFRLREDKARRPISNNYMVTAYQREIG
jgi:hypothetical protein